MRWRIYYGDGSTFDSEMGEPKDAPSLNVQAVIQPDHDVGRTVTTGFDWYWWRADEGIWYGGDLTGFLDQAMTCGAVWPKQARSLITPEYRALMQRVIDDPDFPVKSAWNVGEAKKL